MRTWRPRAGRWLAGAALAGAALAACGPAPESEAPPAPEVVDVEPRFDSGIDLSGDVQGVLPSESLSGVLPGDFPAGFPVYAPASVTDFGRGEGGGFVVLSSSDPAARVRAGQLERLRGAGWQVTEEGGGATARRGGESVRLTFRGGGGGTEIRITYR